jgi:putative redox protein
MANNIEVSFLDSTEGIVNNETMNTNVSFTGKGFAPYELFLGGFASCLHATFMGIANKRRLKYESVKYQVTGEKREEVPTLLKFVKTTITATGVAEKDQKKFIKSMEQAEKYCSISATIKMIAETEFEINFE